MGFRVCYIASKLPPRALATALNLDVVEQVADLPDGEWWVADLKQTGWSVLWSEDENFGFRNDSLLAEAACKADLIHCVVNETCMWSSSYYWSEGRLLWSVQHKGDGDDVYDLSMEGDLPSAFEGIKNQHTLAQNQDAEVDHIFEIPVELAETFTGFRHDAFLEPDDVNGFHIVRPVSKKGFFSKLFKR